MTATRDDDVVAAVPVLADGAIRGILVVTRPDEPLDHRVAALWLALAAVALAALGLATGLATAAARWVGVPLRRLQGVAHTWAEGSLHGRADAAVGPPEVRETALALNAMAARLDTLVHASRAVVADVSHQLRTPLAAMRLRLELVRDELAAARPSTTSEDVDVALSELVRLSRLVDGLLTVSRAESSDTVKTAIDVGAVVRDRMIAWEPVAADRGVTLRIDSIDDAIASATLGHLDQILDNLLDNSLEVLADGGQIDLRVRRDNDGVTVQVDDNGPGMVDALQQSAFHRFASGRPGGGTGLGLAVVHRLVTADGGDVALGRPPGGGTRVTVRLPAARRSASHEANTPVDHTDRQRR
jgi:signal transduction histidine kinase